MSTPPSSALLVKFSNQFSQLGNSVNNATKSIIDFNSNIAKESFAKIDYLKEVRDKFGGFSYDTVMAKQSIEGLAGYALQSNIDLLEVAAGSKDSIIQFNNSLLDGKKAFLDFFKDPKEAANLFNKVMTNIINDVPNLIKTLEDGDNQRIAFYRKTLNINAEDTSKLLQKQYAFTGKASSEILGDIASISDSLAKKTGQAANDLKTDIIKITTDIDRFGDIGVDSAGRISAALNQLGMTTESYTGILDKFMNFDSAAENVGKISQLFGVQMDAMEMTYLANEDQEEFLYRLREQLLDTGVDIDNMSNARLKQMASAVNLNVTQFKTLMREGEMAFDQFDLEDATDENLSKTQEDKLTIAAEKFGDKYQGTLKDAKDRAEALEQQHIGKLTPAILGTADAAKSVADEYNKIVVPEKLADISEAVTQSLNVNYKSKMSGIAKELVVKYNEVSDEIVSNSDNFVKSIGNTWNSGMKIITDGVVSSVNLMINQVNTNLNTNLKQLDATKFDAGIDVSTLRGNVSSAKSNSSTWQSNSGMPQPTNTGGQGANNTSDLNKILAAIQLNQQNQQNQQNLYIESLMSRPLSVGINMDGQVMGEVIIKRITAGQNYSGNKFVPIATIGQ